MIYFTARSSPSHDWGASVYNSAQDSLLRLCTHQVVVQHIKQRIHQAWQQYNFCFEAIYAVLKCKALPETCILKRDIYLPKERELFIKEELKLYTYSQGLNTKTIL